jgi:hypothetical protein
MMTCYCCFSWIWIQWWWCKRWYNLHLQVISIWWWWCCWWLATSFQHGTSNTQTHAHPWSSIFLVGVEIKVFKELGLPYGLCCHHHPWSNQLLHTLFWTLCYCCNIWATCSSRINTSPWGFWRWWHTNAIPFFCCFPLFLTQ